MKDYTWVRLHVKAATDPKICRLPEWLQARWWRILCLSATSPRPGDLPSATSLQWQLRLSATATRSTLDRLIAAELVDVVSPQPVDGEPILRMHDWSQWQYEAESHDLNGVKSTGRVRAYRERETMKRVSSVSCNVSETVSETDETVLKQPLARARDHARAQRQNTDTDTDTETHLGRARAAPVDDSQKNPASTAPLPTESEVCVSILESDALAQRWFAAFLAAGCQLSEADMMHALRGRGRVTGFLLRPHEEKIQIVEHTEAKALKTQARYMGLPISMLDKAEWNRRGPGRIIPQATDSMTAGERGQAEATRRFLAGDDGSAIWLKGVK